MADDDARDERVAAWLEPEPLDELTRRRLVATAMRESESDAPAPAAGRSSNALRWIATAAAIVVVLVGALALLTAPGGNDEQRASAPVRTPERSQSGSTSAAGTSGAAADSGVAAPQAAAPPAVDVGDFGDLDRAANLARLRTALEGADSAFASRSLAESTGGSTVLAALPCRDRLPAGTVTALGSGTLDGRHAVVVLTDLGNGTRSIDAVLSAPCEVRPLS